VYKGALQYLHLQPFDLRHPQLGQTTLPFCKYQDFLCQIKHKKYQRNIYKNCQRYQQTPAGFLRSDSTWYLIENKTTLTLFVQEKTTYAYANRLPGQAAE